MPFHLSRLRPGSDGLIVSIPDVEDIGTKKSHRELATAILAIHEVALLEKTREKQRQIFLNLLFKLLARW